MLYSVACDMRAGDMRAGDMLAGPFVVYLEQWEYQMRECSKSISRRLGDPRFARNYFVGDGVDIGGKPDPLSLYQELFPLMTSVRTWDWEDGDAEFMQGVPDSAFGFVFASHCLEHLGDPRVGLTNWLRILKPGGHLIITIPDEDLYEQGRFPSTFNRDHKWTFTISKARSWCEKSINVVDLVKELGAEADVRKIELLDTGYRYALPRFDQSLTPIAECAIEFIVRKRLPVEIEAGGPMPSNAQPPASMRLHLNQYRNDQKTLRAANATQPPFVDDSVI